MQLFSLILANALLLALICLGAFIERRVSALELTRRDFRLRVKRGLSELDARLSALEERATAPDDPEAADNRVKDAEKRFTQGVANIFGYDLMPDKPDAAP